jgi:hypothetical protein
MVKRDVADQLGEDSRDKNGLKLLSCYFWDDVLCSHRKDARFGVMIRCSKCSHYERWERMMDEEDEIDDEIDEMRKHPDRYRSGELR